MLLRRRAVIPPIGILHRPAVQSMSPCSTAMPSFLNCLFFGRCSGIARGRRSKLRQLEIRFRINDPSSEKTPKIIMKLKPRSYWKVAVACFGALAPALAIHAQVNTNPVPNLTISWDLNQDGFANAVQNGGQPVPNTPAGLALATNWNDGWEENSSSVSGVPPITVNNLYDST